MSLKIPPDSFKYFIDGGAGSRLVIIIFSNFPIFPFRSFSLRQFCFDFLCDRIDFPQRELPWSEDKHRRKEKDKKHYTEFYEKRTENMIRDVYSEDIRTWGYEFGD